MRIAAALLMILLAFSAATAAANKVSSEEAQFQRWLVKWLSDPEDDDLQNLVYGYALTDLNGDGRNEAVVWARNGRRCGTGGCNLRVFAQGKRGWRLFSDTTITRPPIKVLATRTRGWRDLSVWLAGGGIQRGYEGQLRFNGTEYEIVWPADWTGLKHPRRLDGRVIIKDATIPLFPSRCRPTEEAPSVFGPLPVASDAFGSC